MHTFTPTQYVMIDVANNFGLDKKLWQERLDWVINNANSLEILAVDADNPTLYMKSVRALDDALEKRPSGHLVALDATTSGIQIMSALAGCRQGCEASNLIDTGERRDVYTEVANKMSKLVGSLITRAVIKHPIMTHFYGSTAKPKSIFGKGTKELDAFYKALNAGLPGATSIMKVIQAAWDPKALEYSWILPDGHVARFKVMQAEDKKIEVDEFNHATFTYRAYVNKPAKSGLSLAANVIHSIDGYIVREMYRRCDFDLVTIHDSFWCHPNNVHKMRETYNNIFADDINIDLFNSIMKDLNATCDWEPFELGLNSLFRQADYAIS